MNIDSRVPTSLKIVAGLYILVGANSLWQMVSSLSQNSFSINFGFMALFIGYGLLKLKNGWRKAAVILSWLMFLMIASGGIMLVFFTDTVSINIFEESGGTDSKVYGYAVLTVFFFITLWQYRILTNTKIKKLFK